MRRLLSYILLQAGDILYLQGIVVSVQGWMVQGWSYEVATEELVVSNASVDKLLCHGDRFQVTLPCQLDNLCGT